MSQSTSIKLSDIDRYRNWEGRKLMTINTKETALQCIRDDELPIAYIYDSGFHGDEGKRWSFFTHKQYDDMYTSPWVHSPVCLKYDGELTDEGKEFIATDS
jgi:hypothetical protein